MTEKLSEKLRAVDHMSIEDCFLQSPLFAQAADALEAQAARIEVLEEQLKAALDRESATQARHDERMAKLEAENARLREALERISLHGMMNEPKTVGVIVNMQAIARAALGGNHD